MRYVLSLVLMLMLPAAVSAQQAGTADDASDRAEVRLEQTVTPEQAANAPSTVPVEIDTDRAQDLTETPTENAPVAQDPGTNQWWYIVGAVVVGGLILALLL